MKRMNAMIQPHWKPLIDRLGEKRCAGFMFMGRVNGINLYKHGIARLYLNLDDRGQCYVYRGKSHFDPADFAAELQKIEKTLATLGETMESVYDEAYIEQKTQDLRTAGIVHERIEIDPQEFSIN
jgi:hypothetical protein